MRAIALALLLALGACRGGGADAAEPAAAKVGLATVTIDSAAGPRTFRVEVASTPEAQSRGLMYRTDIPRDGGMLFVPYPAEGGGPREGSFWMRNTPTPLDILFIRADGTIARIAENTVPFSEETVRSGEPVSAVLEILGGRATELGIAEGDRVRWTLPR